MVKGFSLAQGQGQFSTLRHQRLAKIQSWQLRCSSQKFYPLKFAATRARYTMDPSNQSFKADGFAAA